MSDLPKSMGLFFIDNKHQWPSDARLTGSLVIWTDPGKYPTSYPVASATHPHFRGRVVVQASTRSLIVSFIHDAKSADDVMKALSAMPKASTLEGAAALGVCFVRQVRIAIDSIIHGLILDMFDGDGGHKQHADLHPFTLLRTLAHGSPKEAKIIMDAFKSLMKQGQLAPDDWSAADDMLSNIESAIPAPVEPHVSADDEPPAVEDEPNQAPYRG